MAGSRYILVEFDPSAPYSFIYMAIRKCATEGYLPIVAHVERYRSVHGPGKAQETDQPGRISADELSEDRRESGMMTLHDGAGAC